MARIRDLARLVRSKNAGPFMLTFDILFPDAATYERVRQAEVISLSLLSRLYGVAPSAIHLYFYDPAWAIKVSMPRHLPSGHPADGDVFGGQQYAPLLDLEIPDG